MKLANCTQRLLIWRHTHEHKKRFFCSMLYFEEASLKSNSQTDSSIHQSTWILKVSYDVSDSGIKLSELRLMSGNASFTANWNHIHCGEQECARWHSVVLEVSNAAEHFFFFLHSISGKFLYQMRRAVHIGCWLESLKGLLLLSLLCYLGWCRNQCAFFNGTVVRKSSRKCFKACTGFESVQDSFCSHHFIAILLSFLFAWLNFCAAGGK